MSGCPHMFGYPLCVCAPLYLDACVCLEDVWIPTVHIQHKESMLCQTEGMSICPLYIWMHPYVWMPPVCLDIPIYLDTTHVWMSLIPLDAPYIWGHPNMQGAAKHMESIQTYRGCANMWGIQPYRGVSKHRGQANIWGSANIWGCPNIQVGIQAYGGIQTYGRCQNIWEHPNIQGVHPSILGAYGYPLTLTKYAFCVVYVQRESKCMGAYGHPLSLTKHAFFVFCMDGGIQTYGGQSNLWGVSKHTGHPNIWGHPNIQEAIQ